VFSTEDPLVLSVPEVSRLLRLSPTSVYSAIHKRQIDSVRIGRRLLVPRASIEALLTHPEKSNAETPAGNSRQRDDR